MTSARITETARTALEPVNPKLSGQYEVLVDLVRRRVGPDHARLFAEPAPITSGKTAGGTAWFAEDGEARPVADLGPDEAAALRAEADRLTGELRAFADRLDREGPASRDVAKLLRDALVLPEEDALWSVDGRPVLVGWGHRRAGERAAAPASAFVTASGASRSEAAVVPSAPSPINRLAQPPANAVVPKLAGRVPRPRWLPALTLLLILACLLALGERLFRACAIGSETWPAPIRALLPDACPVPAASAAATAAIASLDADLRARERDLMGRALSCAADRPVPPERRVEIPAPPVPVTPVPQAAPASDEPERRLENVRRGRYLEVTLLWEGSADLDLHVRCPGGAQVAFNSRTGCGGLLAADLNANGGMSDSRPIEHVVWDAEPVPAGTYGVEVNLFDRHGDLRPSIPYRIVLWRDGQQVRQESGQATTPGTFVRVLTFTSPFRP